MAKYLQIGIPKPCSEDWNKMHDHAGGKFCDSCQKMVIDFSSMSDEQLLKFFKKNNSGICGRFREEQLLEPIPMPVKKIPWLSYALRIAIPAMLVTAKANAQQIVQKAKTEIFTSDRSTAKVQADSQRIVHGKVIDSSGKPVPFASVIISGSRFGVSADVDGNFFLKIKDRMFLEASSVGYKTTKRMTDLSNDSLFILLERDFSQRTQCIVTMAGGVIVRSTRAKKKKPEPAPAPAPVITNSVNSIIVFPNPVKSFSPVNIRWKDAVSSNQEISLFDISGILVYRETIVIGKPVSEASFNAQVNKTGYYVLRVTDSKTGKTLTSPIIVE